jgi:hypothetical protein
MESKRALLYNADTGEFKDVMTWDAYVSYYYGPASDVIETPLPLKQYYELMDDLPAGESQKLVVDLFKEGAFGVRLRKPEGGADEEPNISVEAFHRLPQVIGEELAKERPHLVPLWAELTKETNQSC